MTREAWTAGRRLVRDCPSCYWQGEPYEPEPRQIETVRDFSKHVQHAPGQWCSCVFDGFGHFIVDSHNVGETREEAEADAVSHLHSYAGRPGYGKCVALLWPPGEINAIRIEVPA